MKFFFFILSLLFVGLTIAGSGYVLSHQGTVNAGYAVVPMVFALTSLSLYRRKK